MLRTISFALAIAAVQFPCAAPTAAQTRSQPGGVERSECQVPGGCPTTNLPGGAENAPSTGPSGIGPPPARDIQARPPAPRGAYDAAPQGSGASPSRDGAGSGPPIRRDMK